MGALGGGGEDVLQVHPFPVQDCLDPLQLLFRGQGRGLFRHGGQVHLPRHHLGQEGQDIPLHDGALGAGALEPAPVNAVFLGQAPG